MLIPPIIDALLVPAAFPEDPGSITLAQTHVSYLIFTDRFVYKIKKPVDFGFLDFTTIEKRLFFCEEEVRLNSRLAPGVYLGVVKVVSIGGEIKIEREGEAIEYAVKMKRLASESMLERALEKGEVPEEVIRRVARVVAAFHAEAEVNEHIASFGLPEFVSKNTSENFIQTRPFIGRTISNALYERLKYWTEGFLDRNGDLFRVRAGGGFVRDCHGDIHSGHISIVDGINIIDCIEFNERFRHSDIVADMAFLSMDLDYHNRRDLSRAFDDEYFRASKDAEGARLLDFYKCYRAYVRGKVEGFKSTEKEVPEGERLSSELSARYHFHLAGLYASRWRPTVIIMRGLSGTGKSTLARMIADVTNLAILSTDNIRKVLAGLKPTDKARAKYGEGIYSTEFTERTYIEMIDRAAALLAQGRSVILDATFSKARHAEEARMSALKAGARSHIIECVAGDDAVKGRFLKRDAECAMKGIPVSDAGWEVYLKQKEIYEAVRPDIMVNSERPFGESLSRLFEEIFG
ncbi:MAG: AAA family ATPase [Deltaproteobacteria bacterium]|nr:AAA family ATPase [Deltaproteobacteria bacterium]